MCDLASNLEKDLVLTRDDGVWISVDLEQIDCISVVLFGYDDRPSRTVPIRHGRFKSVSKETENTRDDDPVDPVGPHLSPYGETMFVFMVSISLMVGNSR